MKQNTWLAPLLVATFSTGVAIVQQEPIAAILGILLALGGYSINKATN